MNKNLITGLGVLAVAGVAYYFWRRSQLVLAKEKSTETTDTTDTTDNINETKTANQNKTVETNTNANVSTTSPSPSVIVGTNTGKKQRNFRKLWQGRGGKAKYLELNRDKIAEKLAQAQSQFYGQEKLETPSIGVKEYPLGRYFNTNRMVDEANY